jgi:hypothetical protein
MAVGFGSRGVVQSFDIVNVFDISLDILAARRDIVPVIDLVGLDLSELLF